MLVEASEEDDVGFRAEQNLSMANVYTGLEESYKSNSRR